MANDIHTEVMEWVIDMIDAEILPNSYSPKDVATIIECAEIDDMMNDLTDDIQDRLRGIFKKIEDLFIYQ